MEVCESDCKCKKAWEELIKNHKCRIGCGCPVREEDFCAGFHCRDKDWEARLKHYDEQLDLSVDRMNQIHEEYLKQLDEKDAEIAKLKCNRPIVEAQVAEFELEVMPYIDHITDLKKQLTEKDAEIENLKEELETYKIIVQNYKHNMKSLAVSVCWSCGQKVFPNPFDEKVQELKRRLMEVDCNTQWNKKNINQLKDYIEHEIMPGHGVCQRALKKARFTWTDALETELLKIKNSNPKHKSAAIKGFSDKHKISFNTVQTKWYSFR